MKNHRITYFFNRSAGGQHDPDYPLPEQRPQLRQRLQQGAGGTVPAQF